MNLFDLGGQHLRVGKAITPPEGLFASAKPIASPMPTATALAVATITAQLQAKDVENNPQSTVATSQMSNNPLTQVGFASGPLAPTTVAAALSAASYSGATAVTSVISNILNPTAAVTNPIPQAPVVSSPGIRSNVSFVTPAAVNLPTPPPPTQQTPIPPPLVIIPPPPPPPTLLEEPPIPIGLKAALEQSPHQQQYPSISLVLPTNKSESINDEKPTASLSNVDDPSATLSQQEELSVKGREQRHLLMQKLNQRRLDSRVCVLKNMVGPEDVDEDLQQDVKDECSKYGEVVDVVIYKEQQGEDDNAEQLVKIFVEFRTSKQVEKTVESLNGRYFGGRVIKAELYDQAAYEADDLSDKRNNIMKLSPIVRFLSSNGFYVHIKNKTPNWQPLLSQGEKIIGYPSSLNSLVNLKYLFNEEVSTLIGYLRKLVGTQHPLLKLGTNMLESPPKTAHSRSVLLLLISKAAGIPQRNYQEDMIKHGIHEHQRQLAELIEMIHLGILGHRGIVDLKENQYDLEQGNKIAVLGGDYLLSQACGKLAEFGKPQVVETIGNAIADMCKADFYLKDKQSLSSLTEWYQLTALSVANLVASGCRASLQLVDHPSSFQDQAYYLCRHIIFSCIMYNEISQYSSSISNDSSTLALYGNVPIDRSFPYSISTRSTNDKVTVEELNDEKLLDKCREQCLRESNKALELLQTNFDQKSSATALLRSIIKYIQDGLSSKTVI
ncbi:unnamed protein product [Adineta steineri]|uniref:RRM domain-containing protein n=1 Tax=Adineta steineri TaxID=433720 RepID=A0A814H349_9BILA|nr:unnamed protein product [Adineta steineri]